MQQQSECERELYVPASSRLIENGHIFFWLIKDACWALGWKPGGIFMIFPTVSMAFYLLWKARKHRSEVFHNLAVCLWILANSVWMLSEFFAVEKMYKKYAIVLFAIGIVVLLVYYIFFFRKDKRKQIEYLLMAEEASQN